MYDYINLLPEHLRKECDGKLEDSFNLENIPKYEEVTTLSNLYDRGKQCC